VILVVLAAHASSAARSIVHSHQDSFGHQLEVVGRTADVPGRLDIACACGWRGSVTTDDVESGASGADHHRAGTSRRELRAISGRVL
jgi:hypothetical protein